MRRTTPVFLLAVLALAGACSEQPVATAPSGPDAGALFAKGRGGNGSPHFSDDGTACTFNAMTGRLACDYQLAGLASNSSGAGALIGNVMLSWFCDYTGSSRDYSREVRRLAIDYLYYADESGNARGQVEGTAAGGAFCVPKFVGGVLQTPAPSNVMFSLNSMSSPLALPLIGPEGSWSLSATLTTPKKGLQYVFYIGAWTPAEPS